MSGTSTLAGSSNLEWLPEIAVKGAQTAVEFLGLIVLLAGTMWTLELLGETSFDDDTLGIPCTNEPWGFPKSTRAANKFNESKGLKVAVSGALSSNEANHPNALFAIKKFAKGEAVTTMWGKLVTRGPQTGDDDPVRSIALEMCVPEGQSIYIKTDDERMAAGYINDPTLSSHVGHKAKCRVC